MRDAGARLFRGRRWRPLRESGNDLAAIAGAVRAATGQGGALYMPLRVALTGRAHGPELAPLLKAMPPGKARETAGALRS